MYSTTITFVELSDEELKQQLQVIAEVRPVILKWCQRIYGENNYKQFRYEYLNGKLPKFDLSRNAVSIPNKDRAQLERLQVVEVALLQHNIRACAKIARRYYQYNKRRLPGVEYADFLQEATMALVDSVYAYNGSSKFVTYIYQAINNRMKDFVRTENPLSPPSPDIVEVGNLVSDYMNTNGCNFDQAAIDLKLSSDDCYNARKVNAVVLSQDSKDEERSTKLNSIKDHRNNKVDDYDPLMMEALNTSGLSEVEREVFNAYLMNETGYQTRIASERRVTRSAISLSFRRAKEKLRARYFELAPSEAENYVKV